jgi:hypothetical protein
MLLFPPTLLAVNMLLIHQAISLSVASDVLLVIHPFTLLVCCLSTSLPVTKQSLTLLMHYIISRQ